MKEMNEKMPYEKAQMQVIEIQSEAFCEESPLPPQGNTDIED